MFYYQIIGQLLAKNVKLMSSLVSNSINKHIYGEQMTYYVAVKPFFIALLILIHT